MSKERSENKRKAYMRYVLHYLTENVKILDNKGFHSVRSFIERERNFRFFSKNSPNAQKKFYRAFNQVSTPETDTLNEIQKAFNIPLSFYSFETEIENKNQIYTKYLGEQSSDGAIEVMENNFENTKQIASNFKINQQEVLAHHFKLVAQWSKDIRTIDLRDSKSITELFIELDIYFIPRKRKLTDDENETFTVYDLLSHSVGHIVLLGQAGTGKTTCVKRMANMILVEQKLSNEKFDFPLLIELHKLKVKGFSLFAEIFITLGLSINEDQYAKDRELFIKLAVSAYLNTNKIFVILEGFDELSDDPSKKLILEEIRELFLVVTVSKIIVTSRTADLVDIALDNSRAFEIAPLKPEQILLFAKKWFQNDNKYNAFEVEAGHISYNDVLTRPLLLSLLCSIFERTERLYDKPTEAYSIIFNLLIEAWNKQKLTSRGTRYRQLSSIGKLNFLAHIAFYFSCNSYHKKAFTSYDLIECYSAIHPSHNLPENECFDVVAELESHTGIFVQDGYESFKFYHLSFQEYLAAHHLLRLGSIPEDISHLIPEGYINLSNLSSELAIATSVNVSNNYLIELILKRLKTHISISFVKDYVSRLLIEKPIFSPDIHIALCFLLMNTIYENGIEASVNEKNILVERAFQYFFASSSILESLKMLKKTKALKEKSRPNKYIIFQYINPEDGPIDLGFLNDVKLKLNTSYINKYW